MSPHFTLAMSRQAVCSILLFFVPFISVEGKALWQAPREEREGQPRGAAERLLSKTRKLIVNPILLRDENFLRGTLWSDDLHPRLLQAIKAEGEALSSANATSNRRFLRRQPCQSKLFKWALSQVRSMGYNSYQALVDNRHNITWLPYVYKLYIDRGIGGEEYFGLPGPETANITRDLMLQHEKAEAFWRRSGEEEVNSEWEEYGSGR